jgi:hypothetical protein
VPTALDQRKGRPQLAAKDANLAENMIDVPFAQPAAILHRT